MILESKNIRLRFVEETDVEFILSMRVDVHYNEFLSNIDADLKKQREWIRKYKEDEKAKKQFYFIIERLNGTPCGTFRIYDLEEEYFTLGSWILNEDKTRFAVLESAILASKFGFEELGYKKYRFDVMKANKRTISFYKKIGAVQIGEDEESYFFELTEAGFYKAYDSIGVASMLK